MSPRSRHETSSQSQSPHQELLGDPNTAHLNRGTGAPPIGLTVTTSASSSRVIGREEKATHCRNLRRSLCLDLDSILGSARSWVPSTSLRSVRNCCLSSRRLEHCNSSLNCKAIRRKLASHDWYIPFISVYPLTSHPSRRTTYL